jgi:competence ComEA-like helix-hairpin-helix protein
MTTSVSTPPAAHNFGEGSGYVARRSARPRASVELLPMNMRVPTRAAATLLGLVLAVGSPFVAWADGELIVNVNTATEKQLQTLPGIGEHLAHEIAKGRKHHKFKKLEDLERIKGIGPDVLHKIQPYVKFEGETEPT